MHYSGANEKTVCFIVQVGRTVAKIPRQHKESLSRLLYNASENLHETRCVPKAR